MTDTLNKPRTIDDVYHPWLHRICVALAVCTFVLIVAGGTVTTKDYGMAVPDWPTSYGKWFIIPLELWSQSPIFWEHTHRFIGAIVGALAIMLAAGAFVFEHRAWVKSALIALLVLIIVQGLMGGFRVTTETDQMAPWISLTLRILHGVTGQLVLGLVVLMAVVLGKRWWKIPPTKDEAGQIRPAVLTADKIAMWVLLGLLVAQLTLGAMVRHQGAVEHVRLSIPDFPLAYGQVVPPMTQDKLDAKMAEMPQDTRDIMLKPKPVLPGEEPAVDADGEYLAEAGRMPVGLVHLHFTHRLGAMLVFVVSIWVLSRVAGMLKRGADERIRTSAVIFAILLVLQVSLGVLVVWSGRHDEVTTGHQTVGAALLATAVLLASRVWRQGWVSENPTGVSDDVPTDDVQADMPATAAAN